MLAHPSGRSRPLSLALALLALSALVLSASPSLAQGRDFGRVATPAPTRTDNGVWEGTWTYVNRNLHVALWVRGKADRPEVRMQFLNLNNGEGFITDWEGTASYQHRGRLGTFDLDVTSRDRDLIVANWSWILGIDDRREETALVTIYRAGDGRSLVIDFQDLERTYHGGDDAKLISFDQNWTFLKVSSRLAHWEELPF